jgi:hypothetical protein
MSQFNGFSMVESLEGRRLFSCSEFGQAVAAAAKDAPETAPPPAEVVGVEPPGSEFGQAVADAASECGTGDEV